ncbi:MAG: hypothetical protein KDC38_14015 [Planctomycetes bacterium]|nr:hypothetical protein [Planctomycetota bacterium]
MVVSRGKKVVEFDMKKDPPSEADLLKVALGPTGNLRAPTLILDKGKTVLIGFNAEAYEEELG